jgi:hypothetical protein
MVPGRLRYTRRNRQSANGIGEASALLIRLLSLPVFCVDNWANRQGHACQSQVQDAFGPW